MERRTTIQILPLSTVPSFNLKSHTYLRHCSYRCCIILLLFCNEKPTSASSQPLLLHLLANKGLHYLQLHGSHQLQNCRYCNTQNILKRNKRNNYMCKTPQLNFCRKQDTKRHGLPQVLTIIIRGNIIYMNLITFLLKNIGKVMFFRCSSPCWKVFPPFHLMARRWQHLPIHPTISCQEMTPFLLCKI